MASEIIKCFTTVLVIEEMAKYLDGKRDSAITVSFIVFYKKNIYILPYEDGLHITQR